MPQLVLVPGSYIEVQMMVQLVVADASIAPKVHAHIT